MPKITISRLSLSRDEGAGERVLAAILIALLLTIIPSCKQPPVTTPETTQDLLANNNLQSENLEIFLRAFKQEQAFELWAKPREADEWTLLKTYPICQSSGTLGPKRREGDRQVPEGVYHIDRFNPNSSYHLSLGLNYPNASDLVRGDAQAPGSDIFIHGACVTVGCIPLTDPLIEEVYELAELAKAGGQMKIPVHIFPARMQSRFFEGQTSRSDQAVFWRELQPIYAHFEVKRQLPEVRILTDGRYQIIPD